MKRRNGNKWDRNRAHQIENTLIEHTKSDEEYRRECHRSDRAAVRVLCRKALFDPEVDVVVPRLQDWDRCTGWHVNWGYGLPRERDAWRSKWTTPRSEDFMNISGEELRALPQWVQHQIHSNTARAEFNIWWEDTQEERCAFQQKRAKRVHAEHIKRISALEEAHEAYQKAYRKWMNYGGYGPKPTPDPILKDHWSYRSSFYWRYD